MSTTDEELRIRRLERQLLIAEQRVKEREDSLAMLLAAAAYLRQHADNEASAAGCGGTVTINAGCAVPSGTTVTITKGSTSYTGTPNGAGSTVFTPGEAGVWSYSISGPGFNTVTGTFTFACTNLAFTASVVNSFNHTITGLVTGCNLVPLPGATLTLKQGSTTIQSATTDSSGNYSLTWTAGGSNSYVLYCDYNVISPPRFVQTSVNVFTTLCQSLNISRSFNLGPTFVATGYHCDPCGGAIPIKDTLTCTPPFGPPFTLTWTGPGLVWTGSHEPTYTAMVGCDGSSETKSSPIDWQFGGYADLSTTYPCSLSYGSYVCGAPPPCTIGEDDEQLKFRFPTLTCMSSVAVAATSPSSHTNYPFVVTFSMPTALGSIASGTATITE